MQCISLPICLTALLSHAFMGRCSGPSARFGGDFAEVDPSLPEGGVHCFSSWQNLALEQRRRSPAQKLACVGGLTVSCSTLLSHPQL